MSLRHILARRTEIRAELQGILDANPDGTLPAEAEARFAVLETEIAALAVREQRQAALDDLSRRDAGQPVPGTTENRAAHVRINGRDVAAPAAFDGSVLIAQGGARVPVLEARHSLASFTPAEARGSDISFGGFLRALYLGPQSDTERRAMGEASIGTGGAMVPTPLAAGIIDLLRANSVAFRAGARTVPMDAQTLKFARLIADPVGSWRAEGSAIAADQPAMDQVTLNARSWALITRVSRELLDDGQNTDAVLRQVFARTAALALDRAILFGTGAANQPLGIANTPGIQLLSMGTNGSAITGYAKILDAVAALELANAGNITAMVHSPRTARAINGLVNTLGDPMEPPVRLAGVPMLATTSCSVTETQGTSTNASSIILGDFSEVFVGLRTSLQISVLQEKFADTGEVGFVSWLRADVLLSRPAAMARITGVTP